MQTIYPFTPQAADGSPYPLQQHAQQVLLIVNTASACGFTPQLAALEALHQRFHAQGFTVLAFPCNQFGQQEPGDDNTIGAFCSSRYGVTFPVLAKVEVNGAHAAPLWRHLQNERPGMLGTRAIKWNFTKFLIDRHGRVVGRYAPATPPQRLAARIEALLSAS